MFTTVERKGKGRMRKSGDDEVYWIWLPTTSGVMNPVNRLWTYVCGKQVTTLTDPFVTDRSETGGRPTVSSRRLYRFKTVLSGSGRSLPHSLILQLLTSQFRFFRRELRPTCSVSEVVCRRGPPLHDWKRPVIDLFIKNLNSFWRTDVRFRINGGISIVSQEQMHCVKNIWTS